MQRRSLLPGLAALPFAAGARAQPAPAGWSADRPVRLLVGFAPGGSTDTTARVVALFEHQAGVRFTQVSYRGGAPAMADLLSGRIDLIFAPANTPAPVVARLSREVALAARTPQVRERMEQLGYEPVGSTPEEFATFQAAELPRVPELVRISGAIVE